MKKRFTEEQIIGFLKQAAAGTPIKELCRKHSFSDGSFYLWRQKFGGTKGGRVIFSAFKRRCPERAPEIWTPG